MRLGGRERVVGHISDGMLDRDIDSAIFSIWQKPSYFELNSPVYLKSNKLASKSDKRKTENNIIKINSKKILGSVAKTVFKFSTLQKGRIKELVKLVNTKGFDTLVLTDLTITLAKEIKSKLPNVKLIGWIHMEEKAFFESQYPQFKREIIDGISVLDKVVTLTKKQSISYKKYNENTINIPNPTPVFQVKDTLKDNNSKNLLVVARIDVDHKGLDLLVDVLTKLVAMGSEKWKLDVVGSGKLEDEIKFRKMINNANLSDKINLLGALQPKELAFFYQKADGFLMTSRFEGFPMTIGEAFMYGVPVISFDLDGVREISGNSGATLFVDKFNTTEFAKTIQNLLSDENLRDDMKKAAKIRIKEFEVPEVVNTWTRELE